MDASGNVFGSGYSCSSTVEASGAPQPAIPVPVLLGVAGAAGSLGGALCTLEEPPMVQAAAEQPASANSPDYYYTVLLPTASTIRTLTHPGAPTPRRRSATALSPSSRRPMASLSGSKSSTTWAPPSGSSTTLTTSRSTSRRPPPTVAGALAGPKGMMGSCTQTATTTRAP